MKEVHAKNPNSRSDTHRFFEDPAGFFEDRKENMMEYNNYGKC
ncbi:hypothetical protein [Flagellimonas baculiformis]|nr:hypothetical protein [Muricauda sp. D6]